MESVTRPGASQERHSTSRPPHGSLGGHLGGITLWTSMEVWSAPRHTGCNPQRSGCPRGLRLSPWEADIDFPLPDRAVCFHSTAGSAESCSQPLAKADLEKELFTKSNCEKEQRSAAETNRRGQAEEGLGRWREATGPLRERESKRAERCGARGAFLHTA